MWKLHFSYFSGVKKSDFRQKSLSLFLFYSNLIFLKETMPLENPENKSDGKLKKKYMRYLVPIKRDTCLYSYSSVLILQI